MLNAMLDPKAALADAEMEHLLNCGECMQVLGDLVLPDD